MERNMELVRKLLFHAEEDGKDDEQIVHRNARMI